MRIRQPRQLVLALLGELAIGATRQPIPASAFIEVLEAAGVAAPATRATLDRVELRGLIARERRGREIVFSPTPNGIAVLREATARVRDPHPFHAPEGLWTLVTFSFPEELRSLRGRLRSSLTWEGFAPLRDGLWVAPGEIDLGEALEALRGELPAGSILAFHATELPGFPTAESARGAWDIELIRREHFDFIEAWTNPDGESQNPLVARTMLVADWLALLRADPCLPRALLDDAWPADRSLALYRDLRERTAAPARAEFAALIERRRSRSEAAAS